ncbi:MAG: transcriptional regulator [Halochromatium sp.]|nr:transcriptional regulator [Halochromatium sp.]
MFALLGDPTRLGIVLRCRHQRRSVSEIADASSLSMSLVSHHLRLLRTAALLKVEREGRHAYYSVADAHVEHMLDDMVGHVRHTNRASSASIQCGSTALGPSKPYCSCGRSQM